MSIAAIIAGVAAKVGAELVGKAVGGAFGQAGGALAGKVVETVAGRLGVPVEKIPDVPGPNGQPQPPHLGTVQVAIPAPKLGRGPVVARSAVPLPALALAMATVMAGGV